MTSKLQFTLPKAVAEKHGIVPGTELQVESADDVIRLRVTAPEPEAATEAEARAKRARDFDQASARQAERDQRFRYEHADLVEAADERGWDREDLYTRGLAR